MGFQGPLREDGVQRHFNRLRLGVPARLHLTHEACDCLLDDISSSGARLRIERPIGTGTTALLRFHELKVYATVMWCRNGECGLRFDQALPLEDMQGMLWITENRELYARICSQAQDWSDGIG